MEAKFTIYNNSRRFSEVRIMLCCYPLSGINRNRVQGLELTGPRSRVQDVFCNIRAGLYSTKEKRNKKKIKILVNIEIKMENSAKTKMEIEMKTSPKNEIKRWRKKCSHVSIFALIFH